MPQKLLLVDDDNLQRLMIGLILEKKLGYKIAEATNGKQAVEMVQNAAENEFGAVIMDISMPEMNGFEALKLIRELRPSLPVVMLTAETDASIAVQAIKAGAFDFVSKPPTGDHLQMALHNATRFSSLTQEVARLRRDKAGNITFADLIGHSGGLQKAITIGKKAASSDVPVLIGGETGTGKELFARAIHGESRRVGAPFIAINCGAIPENLIESALFGHEKGAFTGAINRTLGKFREAEGGTIFLDEIGELPLEGQVKLLRVLQQKEVEPVGSAKPVSVNVRIISATNRDLQEEVKAGRFREDLYFRLNVLPITLPPLRDRKEDVLPLTHYFLKRFASSGLTTSAPFSSKVENYLSRQTWRGNVRELENIIHRALVLCDGHEITEEELKHSGNMNGTPGKNEEHVISPLLLPLRTEEGIFKTLEHIEQEAMQRVLNYYDGNITRASEALGIAKSTFYRKTKAAG